MYTENRLSIVQVGGLLPLGSAAQVMDLEIQREVAACLCHVSLSDENKVPIVISNAIKPMLMLCQSADVEVARLACGAAANIAEDPMTHRPLVYKVNAMHTLCYLMRSKHMSVHREASRAVSNLLSTTATHSVFLDEDGLRSLFSVARSQDNECQYNAALCFRKLSPNLGNHDAIISKGGLPVSYTHLTLPTKRIV